MENIKLGQQITVTSSLIRNKSYFDPYEHGRTKRTWIDVPLKEPVAAIVIGVRTLSNGETEYDKEAGAMYYPTEHFKALLVVTNLNNVPFFVKLPLPL